MQPIVPSASSVRESFDVTASLRDRSEAQAGKARASDGPAPGAERGAAAWLGDETFGATFGRTLAAQHAVADAAGAMHSTVVYAAINAATDPQLAARLAAGQPVNVWQLEDGQWVELAISIAYFDALAQLCVLVVPPALAHREWQERAAFCAAVGEAATRGAVPAFVRNFITVIGARGLSHLLAQRANQAAEERAVAAQRQDVAAQHAAAQQQRHRLSERAQALQQFDVTLTARERALQDREAQVQLRGVALDGQAHELAARELALAAREAAATAQATAAAQTVVTAAPAARRRTQAPSGVAATLSVAGSVATSAGAAGNVAASAPRSEAASDAAAGVAIAPAPAAVSAANSDRRPRASAPPIGAARRNYWGWAEPRALGNHDALATSRDPVSVQDAPWVRTALTKAPAWLHLPVGPSADPTATAVTLLAANVRADARAQWGLRAYMPRRDGYPLIVLVLTAERERALWTHAAWAFDPAAPDDAAALTELVALCAVRVALVADGQIQDCQVIRAPLGENLGYMLRTAREETATLRAAERVDRALAAMASLAETAWHPSMHDTLAGEFRDDKLRQLTTTTEVRRAVAMARRFSKPSGEEYLVCTRGYPLGQWRELQRQLVAKAIHMGLWMGTELAQFAVAEGLVRSRRDLIVRLDAGFAAIARDSVVFDLDAEAAQDNRAALAREAAARGVTLRAERVAVEAVEVAGVIESRPISTAALDAKRKSNEELVALLAERDTRTAAALALCERGAAEAAHDVLAAVQQMSRAEAVRVLGMCVRLGAAAAPALVTGTHAPKPYVRQGCALALAMLRTPQSTAAVIALLFAEPTDIWREVARAIGQIGPTALAVVAEHVAGLGARATGHERERAAWAMAHIGVRGGAAAIAQMAQGQSLVAPIAAQAETLMPMASRDLTRTAPTDESGTAAGREVTVNRAFSRQFFEHLDVASPSAQPAVIDLELAEEVSIDIDLDEEVNLDAELLEDEDALELADGDMLPVE